MTFASVCTRKFITTTLAIVLCSFSAQTKPITTKSASKHKTTIEKISNLYLQSLAQQEQEEIAHATRYQEFVKENNGKLKIDEVQEIFGQTAQLKMAYRLHDATAYNHSKVHHTAITETTLNDLHLFCGDQDTPENHVFANLDKTKTISGKIALQTMLAQPISDIESLKKRQNFIKLLIENDSLHTSINEMLEKIRDGEKEFLSLIDTLQAEVEFYYNEVMFSSRWTKALNKNAMLMQPCTYMIASRELCQKIATDLLLAVYFSYQIDGNIQLKTMGFLLGLFYGSGVFMSQIPPVGRVVCGLLGAFNIYIVGNALYHLSERLPIIVRLKEKMLGVANTLVTTHHGLAKLLVEHEQAVAAVPGIIENQYEALAKNSSTKVITSLKNQLEGPFESGNAASAFARRDDIKNNFVESYKLFGLIDAYASIATLIKHNTHNEHGKYCFAEYIPDKKPIIELTDFWHPMINPDKAVLNSITLGGGITPNNAFITGPNAGGKTTAIRSIGLNILMGQSIGVVCATKARITPFSNIATYLNVADSEGKESLFQAEMRRARTLLDTVKALDPSTFSFVIIDEIFTGTNPKEGTAAAYGVAKKLGSFENSVALITTHFIELTNMAKETKHFNNFKVSVTEDKNGSFTFPYKLEPGVADQHIALKLLGKDGFDDDVLDSANEYMKRKK